MVPTNPIPAWALTCPEPENVRPGARKYPKMRTNPFMLMFPLAGLIRGGLIGALGTTLGYTGGRTARWAYDKINQLIERSNNNVQTSQ